MIPASSQRCAAGLAIEDWWAVVIGVFLVAASAWLFRADYGLQPFVAMPRTWTNAAELLSQMSGDLPRCIALGVVLLALFTPAATTLGLGPLAFSATFLILLTLSVLTLATAAWAPLRSLGVEPPVMGLWLGIVLGNALPLPGWIRQGLRSDLFIKTGIVLLGAGIPWPLLRLAGPIVFLQASLIAVVTFVTIYGVARFLEVDRRLGAMLAAGGSVGGIPAVVAVAGAIRAQRENISIATTMIAVWALGMTILLPLLARAWYLPAGSAGAWIGLSSYADAAGLAAVQTYDKSLHNGSAPGAFGQALWAFTLVKMIGRNLWIGLWAGAASIYSTLRWEASEGGSLEPARIWQRFPKFIIGFVIVSLMTAWTGATTGAANVDMVRLPKLIEPLEVLNNLIFTLSFLSIGASVRFRHLLPSSTNAFIAFAAGIVANLALGFMLSAITFAPYWNAFNP